MVWKYPGDDTDPKKTLFSQTAESMKSTLEMVKKAEKAPGVFLATKTRTI